MLVKFFAGAAEAWGSDETIVDVQTGTFRDIVSRLTEQNADVAEVLLASSLLADGVRVGSLDESVTGVQQLDILPPFAGG